MMPKLSEIQQGLSCTLPQSVLLYVPPRYPMSNMIETIKASWYHFNNLLLPIFLGRLIE